MPSPNESSKKKAIWINGNRYETTDTIGQGGQGSIQGGGLKWVPVRH